MFKKVVKTAMFLTVAIATIIAAAHSNPAASPGASFNEVWNVVTVAPEIDPSKGDLALYGTPDNPKLPRYSSKFEAALSIATGALGAAAKRTLSNHDDYHDYFTKLIHANGICFSGTWKISEDSLYSGLFRKGSSALMIGRISAASPQTTNDDLRSFGFAGKLFPTTDPAEVVQTANFFTVHDLNGTAAPHALGVAFVNEPPADLSGFLNPLKILNAVFAVADVNPLIRPVYPIAHAGLPEGAHAVAPKWMRIRPRPGQQSPTANDADFRDELSAKNYPHGLAFSIEVSDTTKDPLNDDGWIKIGEIRTSSMTTTFGCDRRLHFPHPKFDDPNP